MNSKAHMLLWQLSNQVMDIEFTFKGANDLYLDLNFSRFHVFAKITKADGTNIDLNTAAPIKLTLHPMFC